MTTNINDFRFAISILGDNLTNYMRLQILSLCMTIIVTLSLIGCSGRGEIVTPPDGLEQSVRDFISKDKGIGSRTDYTVHSISVRAYPKDSYLVIADVDYSISTSDTKPITGRSSNKYIVEKGLQNGQDVWQVRKVNPKEIEQLERSVR
jgi:hypothetical protein